MADSTVPKTETEPKTIIQNAAETASNLSSTVTDTAGSAAAAVSGVATTAKDNVFSMFGGGPKKEKREEEAVDEPSGSSKTKNEVSLGPTSTTVGPYESGIY